MRSSLYSRLAGVLLLATAACGAEAPPPDAAVFLDGQTIDAAVIDASPIDAPTDARVIDAPPIDAMVDAPPLPMTNGCTVATAVDRTAVGANRTVSFPGTAYSPRCMKIKLGQTVTWSGTFMNHPLRPGVIVNNSPTGQPGNPIPATDTGASRAVTFNAVGEFGFYCDFHWPGGMAGAIYVVL